MLRSAILASRSSLNQGRYRSIGREVDSASVFTPFRHRRYLDPVTLADLRAQSAIEVRIGDRYYLLEWPPGAAISSHRGGQNGWRVAFNESRQRYDAGDSCRFHY